MSAEDVVADLTAVVGAGLAGVFLAKCTVPLLEQAVETITALELEHGLAPGTAGVIGLVESAAALLQLDVMASNPRLVTFAIGEVDLMADLRMTRSAQSEVALDSLRVRFVVSAAAAGLLPPVAPTSTAVHALEAFADSSQKMFDLGFRSRTAVHPKQVPVIHGVFTPGAADIEAARAVVACMEQAQGGVALDADGRMIDAAVVRGAHEVLLRSTLEF
ncbi:citrate lyase subunit beta/citryl-CoA lyase [Cryobacterium sp. CG_9.6]|nr:citrate lyase subunit beta/citryl-CoA lyase [Cryobacterium sp. CG_9.6]